VRSEHASFLVDGPVLLGEALASGAAVRTVYVEVDAAADTLALADRARAGGVRVQQVVPGALASVLDLQSPQAVVAVVEQRPADLRAAVGRAVTHRRPLLVLVDVADPGNVGTLVRTAEAAGCAGVVLAGSCADLFNPKTVRATAGALFRVAVAACPEVDTVLEALAEAGVVAVATVGASGSAPEQVDLTGAVAVLVGSEAHGLAPEVVQRCATTVSVPMEGAVESLNAGVAGSVVAFDAARQRRVAGAGAAEPQRSGGPTAAVGHNDDPVATASTRSGPAAPEHGSPPR
jgi:TrmH family RNA methyltransferase